MTPKHFWATSASHVETVHKGLLGLHFAHEVRDCRMSVTRIIIGLFIYRVKGGTELNTTSKCF